MAANDVAFLCSPVSMADIISEGVYVLPMPQPNNNHPPYLLTGLYLWSSGGTTGGMTTHPWPREDVAPPVQYHPRRMRCSISQLKRATRSSPALTIEVRGKTPTFRIAVRAVFVLLQRQ